MSISTTQSKDNAQDDYCSSMTSNKLIRGVLVIAGTIFTGLGLLGILLPLLPTTPFLLLAVACYARSSKRFYCWLLNNKWFGTYLRDYRDGKGITLKVKVFVTIHKFHICLDNRTFKFNQVGRDIFKIPYIFLFSDSLSIQHNFTGGYGDPPDG